MVDALVFILVAFVSYFIGTINFSKIIAWNARRKDITKLGSGNPGTMNMLRNFGFVLALATFLAEIAKAGLCCLAFKLLYPEYGQAIYFFSGLFLMLGYNFPVWAKFKGGKGVATFAGIFLFSNLWYVALAYFFVCFVLLIIIDYGSVVSFVYIGGLTIAYTIYVWVGNVAYAWAVTAIIWFLLVLTIIRHRSNIKRLINHTENKVDFKRKLKKIFCHKKGEIIIDEADVNHKPEGEIIVEVDDRELDSSASTDDHNNQTNISQEEKQSQYEEDK